MKLINKAKILLSVMAFVCITLGLFFMFNVSLTSVKASETINVQANSIVVSESKATVTSARETAFTMQNGTDASESFTGLYVNGPQTGNSDVTWKAKINGVFTDNFEMEYLLATPAPYASAYLKISVCDLEGNEVAYSKHLRTNHNDKSWLYNNKVTFGGTNATDNTQTYMLPAQGYYDADATSIGKFIATLDNENILTIKERQLKEGSSMEEITLGTVSAPALENGFIVKFTSYAWLDSNTQSTISLLIASINGVATTGTTVSATSSEASINYEGEYKDGETNYIDLVTGSELDNFATSVTPTIGSLTLPAIGEEFAYSDSFASKTEGAYDITVTNSGLSKNYTVLVQDGYATTNLIKSSNLTTPTVATEKTFTGGGGTAKGIYIQASNPSSESADVRWSTNLNGIFYGSLEMEYLLPDKAKYPTVISNSLSIAICDLEGNIVCEARHYSAYDAGTAWGGRIELYANGAKVIDNSNDMFPSQGYYTSAGTGLGKLQISIDENNTLTVYATKHANSGDSQILIGTLENAETIADGFTVKIYNAAQWSACPSILITSINGVATTGETIDVARSYSIAYEGETVDGANNVITLEKGTEISAFDLTTVATMSNWTNTTVTDLTVSETFADKDEGEYDLTVTKLSTSKAYKVKIIIPKFDVTYIVDGSVDDDLTEQYAIGDSVTLPTATKTGYTLIGWVLGTKLYGQGASVTLTEEDAQFTALFVEFTAVDGVFIRLTEPKGLRWVANLDKATMDSLDDYTDVSWAYGTKITSDGSDKFVDITGDKAKLRTVENNYSFYSALTGIKSTNFERVYYANHYITITYSDGSSQTLTLTPKADSGRSYKGVIEMAYNDTKAEEDFDNGYTYSVTKDSQTVYAKVNNTTFQEIVKVYNEIFTEVE